MIVLDSSFLIGFYNERDVNHAAASALMDQFVDGKWGKGLLLEYVVLKISIVLMLRLDLSVATKVGRILLDADELEFVPCSDLFGEVVEGFSSQAGTRLSFTDTAITNVSRRRADGQVLTFDEEFRKTSGLRINPVSN